MRRLRTSVLFATAVLGASLARADYTNFEVSQVHPMRMTPSGARLLALNTPDAILEVFAVSPSGGLTREKSIPVGLEPVSVYAASDSEAWVVNHLSDDLSRVDLDGGYVVDTVRVGDEPTDVLVADGKLFVTVSGEDRVKVYDPANLDAAPTVIDIFSRKPRALAVSNDGRKVYVVALQSGNQTTVVNALSIFTPGFPIDPARAASLGLDDLACSPVGPFPYPPEPPGWARDPGLPTPAGGGPPQVALIVRWNETASRWEDDASGAWNQCLPFRLPDHDLFRIDTSTLTVDDTVDHLGTALFEVSVHPTNDKIYVANTDARNFVRFEPRLTGHIVDNLLSVVDPRAGNLVTRIDLNAHVSRAITPGPLGERMASISQPGMMTWKADGTAAFLTAIGTRKLFRVDGSCLNGSCIFGVTRQAPRAVEVGEGPTGVALHEASGTVYVLNRFANSIAIVDEASLTLRVEMALHDPSSAVIREGRRFLYDGILGSGHGDASCASCHLSGDLDGLAWDLGHPQGTFVPYSAALDNVRFIAPLGGNPQTCDPVTCASQSGFDPQKGPMTTQTFRGMLEPLHWRGDRPTMNQFNPAFVGLMGTADIGPVGDPKGLDDADMERLRQFTLGIRFPPNPHRNLDDTLPNALVPIPGTAHVGNPATGANMFDTFPSDGGQPCKACHAHPFGAAGGKLGGVTPTEPTADPDAAALFNGNADLSPHNDLKVGHLRNIYAKIGPPHGIVGTPDARSGFGLIHDGSIPDILTFLSTNVFTLSPANAAEQVRHLAAFVNHFDTGTRPCVGQQVTLPGTPADQARFDILKMIADLGNAGRHGELIATGPFPGGTRAFHLSGGRWVTDLGAEPPLTEAELLGTALGPVTFMCVPVGSGERLGGNRDEDACLDGDDCDPTDPSICTPTCGNLVTECTEFCDEGGNTLTCDSDCTEVLCGDGHQNPAAGEECDDSNTTSGDGCSSLCLLECFSTNLSVVRPVLGKKGVVAGTVDFEWPMDPGGPSEYHVNRVDTKNELIDPSIGGGVAVTDCTATLGTTECTTSAVSDTRYYQVLSACAAADEGPF